MAPKMANRRQRRSERQSASSEATTRRWLQQLPDGPCRLAVAHIIDEAISGGASDEVALAQGLVYAARLFPEEIVLWGLEGGTGPVPWQSDIFQGNIRAASVHLRELRSQFVDLARENAVLMDEVAVLRASQQPVQSPEAFVPGTSSGRPLGAEDRSGLEPVQPPADFVPFSGTGHSLGAEDLSGLD